MPAPWLDETRLDARLGDMVENEGDFRTTPHHLQHIRQLMVEDADVERKIVFRQKLQRLQKRRTKHELWVRLVLDQAAHAADDREFGDLRHLRLDSLAFLERQ